MKKLTMIVTGVFLAAGLFGLVAASNATAGGSHEEGSSPGSVSEFWEHMSEMRDIMHNALVSSEPLATGVRINVTATASQLVAAIQEEFGSGRHGLESPYPNTEVEAELLENGVALTYTSNDTESVEGLQTQGNALFYSMLRNNMHELMASQGGFNGGRFGRMGGMHGSGMMGPGPGTHGPGMMGSGMGYGPGMMGGGYSR